MRVVDRHLARELVRFALVALVSVVVIYLLIDLFEELNYFTSRKVSVFTVLLFYAYSVPSAVTLLYPVSLLLAVFVVFGQMVRHRELHALESAGVRVARLFLPATAIALLTVVGYLVGNEFVAIPANAALTDLRRFKIEKRAKPTAHKRREVYFVGEGGRVFFIREYQSDGVMRDFSIKHLTADRHVVRRVDGREAIFRDSTWVGYGVTVRRFAEDGTVELSRHDTLLMTGITEQPADLVWTPRPVEETSTRDLRRYIARLRRAGENVADEEVEFHYRFSYSLIGLVIVLLGLPLSVRMRKGGVMFGLGIGLFVSFLYWGAIQLSRAYGTSHIISPAVAAWLPNLVFCGIAAFLWSNVRE